MTAGAANGSGGRDKKLCGAKKRKTEGLCTRPAGWGTDHVGYGHCKLHGGCTPTQVKGARREMAAEAAAMFGLPREIDPADALLEEVWRTAGHVAWLQRKIADFSEDDDLKQLDMSGKFEKPAVWVELYQAERAHLARVCREAIAVGVEERITRVAERLGDLLAATFRAFIADPELALSPTQHEVALRVADRQLRALGSGEAA